MASSSGELESTWEMHQWRRNVDGNDDRQPSVQLLCVSSPCRSSLQSQRARGTDWVILCWLGFADPWLLGC